MNMMGLNGLLKPIVLGVNMDELRWWFQDLELSSIVTILVMGIVEFTFVGFVLWALLK